MISNETPECISHELGTTRTNVGITYIARQRSMYSTGARSYMIPPPWAATVAVCERWCSFLSPAGSKYRYKFGNVTHVYIDVHVNQIQHLYTILIAQTLEQNQNQRNLFGNIKHRVLHLVKPLWSLVGVFLKHMQFNKG